MYSNRNTQDYSVLDCFFKCNFKLCALCNRPVSSLIIPLCSIGMKILGKLTPKTQLAHQEASNGITQQAAFGSIFQTSLVNSASHVALQHMMTSYHVFTWRTETNLRTSSLMQVRHPKDVTQEQGGLFLANLVQFSKFYFTDGTACVDPQGEEATVVFVGPQSMRTYMASFGYEVKSPDLGVLDRLHASFNNFVQTASRPFGALFRKWNIQMNINPL